MKKLLAVTLVVLLAIAACNAFEAHDYYFHVDGDGTDGPFGALLAMFLAGGGIVLAALIIVAVAIFVCFVFAGVGVLIVAALVLGCFIVAAVIAPLLLPVLIPLAILWWIARRNRDRRAAALKGAAV
ncbi:hypothetical protein ACFFTM_21310 [Pseudoduganella plicata]|uniref:Uncharacterized protein n=1 Tax=Pseudoduganella plicata TaxID=321984 RepID=A0A4P7BKJ0_9BURK|nr:hypothetical protein [Pseudoduganella plicata]QBQ38089.1 hypothetical protein E1742_19280 [Pseudoduganella plicata]GGZ03069.1 hypothetical protein GCM10007388_40890 [Pseudoduganella plicata]